MIVVVPTTDEPFRQQTTVFENVQYVLSFQYNQRMACWFMSIADSNSVDIYNGTALVCNTALLKKCSDPRRPPGEFMVVSSTSDVSAPGQEDLIANGGRCTLLYVTSDWLALIKGGNIASILAQLATSSQAGTASQYGAV